MIFTSKHGKITHSRDKNNVTTYNMKASTPRLITRRALPINTPLRIAPSDGDRMTWGAPTWTLFHTIPEKLTNQQFIDNKANIIRLITTICSNLPCPSCSDHAKQYMSKVNFNAIHTVDDLKKMLYIFHNSVNERKRYAEFPYDDLTDKYHNLDFNQVVNQFMIHFQKKTYAMNLIAQQIHRQKQVLVVKKWFIDNMHIFQ